MGGEPTSLLYGIETCVCFCVEFSTGGVWCGISSSGLGFLRGAVVRDSRCEGVTFCMGTVVEGLGINISIGMGMVQGQVQLRVRAATATGTGTGTGICPHVFSFGSLNLTLWRICFEVGR